MPDANILVLIGRIVLGLFFIIAGVRNFLAFGDRTQMTTNYGRKLPPAVLAIGFAAQLVGGLAVALGIGTIWGAALLIVFLVAATALFHNFLLFQGAERAPHLYFTLVNCSLVGYCLMVIGTA